MTEAGVATGMTTRMNHPQTSRSGNVAVGRALRCLQQHREQIRERPLWRRDVRRSRTCWSKGRLGLLLRWLLRSGRGDGSGKRNPRRHRLGRKRIREIIAGRKTRRRQPTSKGMRQKPRLVPPPLLLKLETRAPPTLDLSPINRRTSSFHPSTVANHLQRRPCRCFLPHVRLLPRTPSLRLRTLKRQPRHTHQHLHISSRHLLPTSAPRQRIHNTHAPRACTGASQGTRLDPLAPVTFHLHQYILRIPSRTRHPTHVPHALVRERHVLEHRIRAAMHATHTLGRTMQIPGCRIHPAPLTSRHTPPKP